MVGDSTAVDVLIVGAGPTGLGAAWRLFELASTSDTSWVLVDSADSPGGMARSVRDEAGFVWDFGGHIIYSHYRYFDDVMAKLNLQWLHHPRSRWIWMDQSMIPYPLQHNVHRLRPEVVTAFLNDLVQLASETEVPPSNFEDWLLSNFGRTSM